MKCNSFRLLRFSEARHTVLAFFQMITTYYENDKEWILRSLPEDLKSHFVAAL